MKFAAIIAAGALLALFAPGVAAAGLPMPSSVANQAGIKVPVNPQSVVDANGNLDNAYMGAVAMVAGTPVAAGRSVQINCTVAGNVALTLADASIVVVPVNVGLSILPYSATAVNVSGTTATATYYNLN